MLPIKFIITCKECRSEMFGEITFDESGYDDIKGRIEITPCKGCLDIQQNKNVDIQSEVALLYTELKEILCFDNISKKLQQWLKDEGQPS